MHIQNKSNTKLEKPILHSEYHYVLLLPILHFCFSKRELRTFTWSIFYIVVFPLLLNLIITTSSITGHTHEHKLYTFTCWKSSLLSPEHPDTSCGTPLNGDDILLTIYNVHSYKAQLRNTASRQQSPENQLTLYDVIVHFYHATLSHPSPNEAWTLALWCLCSSLLQYRSFS